MPACMPKRERSRICEVPLSDVYSFLLPHSGLVDAI
jgi:hypothetical protein